MLAHGKGSSLQPPRPSTRASERTVLLLLAVSLLAATVGCSPEDERSRGNLGSDVGNTALPVQMHGNRERNNPSFRVPDRGRVSRDAKGVPGWWARR